MKLKQGEKTYVSDLIDWYLKIEMIFLLTWNLKLGFLTGIMFNQEHNNIEYPPLQLIRKVEKF